MSRRRVAPPAPRQPFRAAMNFGEALAIDPGGAGLIADLRRGRQPAPGALGLFEVPETPHHEVVDGIGIISITGPLEHRAGWWWHSYEEILEHTEAALRSPDVRAVVHRFASPGGVVAGTGEAHDELLRLRKKHAKPLYAYADEMACSAAYWLACASDEIWCPKSGLLGSVGVIICTIDESVALERDGVKVRYVVSGARKGDLHPGSPVTDDVLKVAQSNIDYLAGLFFDAVGRARGMTPAAVDALEAAVFYGESAVVAGLADGVAAWPEFLQHIRNAIGVTDVPSCAASVAQEKSMAKILQLQQTATHAGDEARSARKALAKAPNDKGALKRLEKALRAKIAADDALAVAQAKTTTTRVIQEQVVVDDGDDEEAMEDDEPEEDEKPEEDSTGADAEDEESEKAVAAAWGAAEKAYRKAIRGHAQESALALHSPARLRRMCRGVTGQSGIRGVFGALDGFTERFAAVQHTEVRVEKLERDNRASRVDKLIAAGRAAGKVVGKAHVDDMRAQGMAHGTEWLQGRLAAMPKVVRTPDEELRPRTDAAGNALGAPSSADQERTMELAMAGLSPEDREKFKADFAARQKKTNGAIPTH